DDRQVTHLARRRRDRKSTRLNSSHVKISYAVFCLKKKNGHGDESPLLAEEPTAERGRAAVHTERLHVRPVSGCGVLGACAGALLVSRAFATCSRPCSVASAMTADSVRVRMCSFCAVFGCCCLLCLLAFFFCAYAGHPDLHSFPTRRSSDPDDRQVTHLARRR